MTNTFNRNDGTFAQVAYTDISGTPSAPSVRTRLTGNTDYYCDFTNGNDNNSGLSSGAGAFKTLQGALNYIGNNVDLYGYNVVINMAASTTDTTGVHFSEHAFVGAQGGAAVKIKGATGAAISTTSSDALGFFCGVIVQIQGPLTLSTTTSGECVNAGLGSSVEILDQVTFGSCAGSHMSASNRGIILITNSYTVSGGATTAHQIAQTGGHIVNQGGSITVTVSADITVTWWVITSVFCEASLPSITYSLGGHTVTGKRYEADNLSLIYTGGGGASYFPGTTGGSTSGGGTYV